MLNGTFILLCAIPYYGYSYAGSSFKSPVPVNGFTKAACAAGGASTFAKVSTTGKTTESIERDEEVLNDRVRTSYVSKST